MGFGGMGAGRRFGTMGIPLGSAGRSPSYDPITRLGVYGGGGKTIAYWDANRADTVNSLSASTSNAPVGANTWADIVAGYSASQPTAANQFIYNSNSYNGYPGLTDDGVGGYMTCLDATLLANLSAAGTFEIHQLLSQDALPADATERISLAIGGTSLLNGVAISRVVTGGVNRVRGRTATGAASTQVNDIGGLLDFSGYHYVRYVMGATQSTLYVDGVLINSASVVPGITYTRLRFGCSSASGPVNFQQGKQALNLITLPLTSAEASELGAWL